MLITWRHDKARRNKLKHGLDFSLAAEVFRDPFAITSFDRNVDGRERWHMIGSIVSGRQFKLVVVVYSKPDPDVEDWVHIISLREATRHEREEHQIPHFR